MNINDYVKLANLRAEQKGFWVDWNENDTSAQINNAISCRLMLIVGEVAEAQEALRKNDPDNFAEELADIAIRLFDLAGGLGVDLETEINNKMAKNLKRPYKHNKLF